MSNNSAPAGNKPFTADLIRSLAVVPAASNSVTERILSKLADAVTGILQSFNPIDMKAVPDGIVETEETYPLPGTTVFHFMSSGELLAIAFSCDSNFALGLCELSFGGTGNEPPFDAEDRPLSKTELRLQHLVFEELSLRLPAILEDVLSAAFTLFKGVPTSLPSAGVPAYLVCGKILINVFGYSGELKIHLDKAQLHRHASATKQSKLLHANSSQASALKIRLDQTTINLRVVLAAEAMEIGELGNLRIGQLIQLASTVATPVRIVSEGVELFTATLARSKNRIALKIANC